MTLWIGFDHLKARFLNVPAGKTLMVRPDRLSNQFGIIGYAFWMLPGQQFHDNCPGHFSPAERPVWLSNQISFFFIFGWLLPCQYFLDNWTTLLSFSLLGVYRSIFFLADPSNISETRFTVTKLTCEIFTHVKQKRLSKVKGQECAVTDLANLGSSKILQTVHDHQVLKLGVSSSGVTNGCLMKELEKSHCGTWWAWSCLASELF